MLKRKATETAQADDSNPAQVITGHMGRLI